MEPEELVEKIVRVNRELKTTRERVSELTAELEFLQTLCPHPATENGSTWGRWEYTRCLLCGKEW